MTKSQSLPLFYFPVVTGGGVAPPPDHHHHLTTMRRRASFLLLFVFLSVVLFFDSLSIVISRALFYTPSDVVFPSVATSNLTTRTSSVTSIRSNVIADVEALESPPHLQYTSSVRNSSSRYVDSVSVLLPDWEVLVIVPRGISVTPTENFTCLYPNNATSQASFSGILPSTGQATFKCLLPLSCRRMPFLAPVLSRPPMMEEEQPFLTAKQILRSNFLVYESFSTEDDVVLFVKGLNNRQGTNRSPSEFMCVFVGDVSGSVVKTAVTSSIQEVFRCSPPPDLTEFDSSGSEYDQIKLKISLEILGTKQLIPTVAYYTPYTRKIAENQRPKSQLCATTMVYNVGKFLKEWVMYHAKLGVDRFLLYDNDSDDDLAVVVEELNAQGYNVETFLWLWPKAQEAGFSHAALYGKEICTWMMYIDVDEFIFKPSWSNSPQPDDEMLRSLLPKTSVEDEEYDQRGLDVGQVSIKCNEFGPSNQKSHPVEGVTQGYICRRRLENRHKSIVLVDAVDVSMANAIHHFKLKEGYRTKQMSLDEAVVNHYKYQAWCEFKSKFRRRVSAYVVNWRNKDNPASKDRTPGLGFKPEKPPGWENMFCEVKDDRLKVLTQRWFGFETENNGYVMSWQQSR